MTTPLMHTLPPEDRDVAIELLRSMLALTASASIDRRTQIVAQAAGTFVGIAMATYGQSNSARSRAGVLEFTASADFEECKNRAAIHATDAFVNGASFGSLFTRVFGLGQQSPGDVAHRKLKAM